MKTIIFLLAIIFSSAAFAQNSSEKNFSFGVEQDFLPWVTGGYYANVWVGKENFRVRGVLARVHKPEIILPDGFTNNWVTAYALVGDIFLKKNFEGMWLSGGLVFWDNTIQSEKKIGEARYQSYLLNGSVGYSWKIFDNFYVSPWAGMHILVAGSTKNVTVDGQSFTPATLNPEASLKIGWYF